METIIIVSRDDESAKKEAKMEKNTGKDRQKSWLSLAGESMGLKIGSEVDNNIYYLVPQGLIVQDI